jgi:hypothetical protein
VIDPVKWNDRFSTTSHHERRTMSIPWVTALQLAKKLLPVVIEKAPDLLKTLERFRPAPPMPDGSSANPELAALLEQIDTHQRTIASQADTIAELRIRLSAAKRSIAFAWIIFAVTMAISLVIILYLLFRS